MRRTSSRKLMLNTPVMLRVKVPCHMTFTETEPVVAQGMVFVAGWQRFASRELPNDVIKKGDVEIPLQGAFVVALEYVCPFDIERRQFVTHRFNSAKAKSRGIPRLSGSLPISSVSRIAFTDIGNEPFATILHSLY